jgi:hypothetical protein
MTIPNSVTGRFHSPPELEGTDVTPAPALVNKKEDVDMEVQKPKAQILEREPGVARVEALQALWGKKGKWLVISGLAMVMII